MLITRQLSKLSSSIIYLAGDGNYTRIHFLENPSALYATTLSAFEKEMPGFVRIHKRFLVNPVYVTDYRSNTSKSLEVLIGKRWLPVSRRRMDEIEYVLRHMEEMA